VSDASRRTRAAVPAAAPARRAVPAGTAMLGVCLIWGVNFSVMKYALESLAPFALNAIRFTLASAVLWGVAVRLEPDTPLPWRTRLRLAGLGVVGNSIYQIMFIVGLTRTTAGNSALLIASTPLLTAVLGSALGVERLTRQVAGAVALGSVGVALVVLAKEVGFSLATMTGDLLTLGAVVFWALFTHGVRAMKDHASPLRTTAWTILGGTPLLVLVGLPDLVGMDWGAVPAPAWGAVLYASLGSIVIAYLIWNRSVHQIGGNRTAIYGVTVPVFALATAAVALGERPTPVQLAGAALIVGSVLLNVRAHREERAAEPAP